MRQIVITRSGRIDVLKVEDVADLKPNKGEVTVAVKASGINFADILARQGLYQDAPKTPCVVGFEVAGVVKELGEGVDRAWLGREVIVLTRFKGQAEQVNVPVDNLFDKPKSLSFAQAAAIPVNYLTAYGMMVVMGALQRGEAILIHNVGGGVGLAALDIAKKLGAISYGTASGSKEKFMKQRGLDHFIDYRNNDWQPELQRLTNNRGVELILDPLGGRSWKKSYRSLRSTGRLGMFGISTASEVGLKGKLQLLKMVIQTPLFHPFPMMMNNRSVFGFNLGHLWHEVEKVRNWMEVILKGVDEGWVQPYVDKEFPFAEVGAAHSYIEARKNIGKVVLVP